MMKSYVRYMVALALVASAPAAAQSGRAGNDTARAGRWQHRGEQGHEARPPFQRLVALRQELQLTDAQVARVQEIGQRLQQRNAPLRAQLATQSEQFKAQRRAQMERLSPEARRDTLRTLRQRGRRRDVPESMRAPMQQMRENTRAAMQEVQSVLTPQQKERAGELMRREHGRRGDEGQRGRGGRRGGREGKEPQGTGAVRS